MDNPTKSTAPVSQQLDCCRRSNESRRPHGRPQRSPRHLPSGTRGRNFSTWNRVHDIGCLLAVGVAVFGPLVGAAVLDRDQRLQLREVIHGV